MASTKRNFAILLASTVFTAGIMACGPGIDSNATSSSSGSSGSGSGSSSSGGSDVCPANTICLTVNVLQGPVSPGRVAVLWFQLSDDGPDPTPVVGYDAAFDPKATRVDIPIPSITVPNEENLLCPRACNDESICPCTGEPKIGIGLVVVGNDANGNGKLDVDEFMGANGPSGVGYMAVGYTATPYATLPAPYDIIFPDGMDEGVRPYHLKKDAQMVFDRMHKAPDGEVFDLNVCGAPADPTCMMPFPNLT